MHACIEDCIAVQSSWALAPVKAAGPSLLTLVVLPHVVVGPTTLIRVRIVIIPALTALPQVVLRIRNAITLSTVGTMIGVVGIP